MTILRADRSECNESEAQDMVGCLAEGERVIAYFPSLSAMRHADLLAAAPELLEALRWVADELPSMVRTHCPMGMPMTVSKAHDIACAAIAKAEGREA